MNPFVLEPSMLTMGGVFYPTGYAIIMFPDVAETQRVGQQLLDQGISAKVMHLKPETVLRDISRTDDGADAPLPSVGTEGATVRTLDELARKGQHGLLVHADSEEETEAVMQVVRTAPFSFAQKYRMLAIQDLQ